MLKALWEAFCEWLRVDIPELLSQAWDLLRARFLAAYAEWLETQAPRPVSVAA